MYSSTEGHEDPSLCKISGHLSGAESWGGSVGEASSKVQKRCKQLNVEGQPFEMMIGRLIVAEQSLRVCGPS